LAPTTPREEEEDEEEPPAPKKLKGLGAILTKALSKDRTDDQALSSSQKVEKEKQRYLDSPPVALDADTLLGGKSSPSTYQSLQLWPTSICVSVEQVCHLNTYLVKLGT